VLKEETLIRGDQGVGITNEQRNFTAGQNIDFHFPWMKLLPLYPADYTFMSFRASSIV
jgi:hypothetical protein